MLFRSLVGAGQNELESLLTQHAAGQGRIVTPGGIDGHIHLSQDVGAGAELADEDARMVGGDVLDGGQHGRDEQPDDGEEVRGRGDGRAGRRACARCRTT